MHDDPGRYAIDLQLLQIGSADLEPFGAAIMSARRSSFGRSEVPIADGPVDLTRAGLWADITAAWACDFGGVW
jgi:hypothetical protein